VLRSDHFFNLEDFYGLRLGFGHFFIPLHRLVEPLVQGSVVEPCFFQAHLSDRGFALDVLQEAHQELLGVSSYVGNVSGLYMLDYSVPVLAIELESFKEALVLCLLPPPFLSSTKGKLLLGFGTFNILSVLL